MAANPEAKTTKELQTTIDNCVRLRRTSEAIYVSARQILSKRESGDLDIEKTITVSHGTVGSFLCYKDIADANGLTWAKSRRRVGPHLDTLRVYSEGKGWPLLSVIVVHKDKLETGDMTEDNLKGFLDAARAAGRTVDIDELSFVKREQKRVFDWCRREH